jgi:hypothetical protein
LLTLLSLLAARVAGDSDLTTNVFSRADASAPRNNVAKIVIITPCSRPQNLVLVARSMFWPHVLVWIIAHMPGTDISLSAKTLARHGYGSKILHLGPQNASSANKFSPGRYGNGLRNLALQHLPEPRNYFVYFLDDDNLMHPHLWRILPALDVAKPRVYTVDSRYTRDVVKILKGSRCKVGFIDTAQLLIAARLLTDVKVATWKAERYDADGVFAMGLCRKYGTTYIPLTLAHYNALKNETLARTIFTEIDRLHKSWP